MRMKSCYRWSQAANHPSSISQSQQHEEYKCKTWWPCLSYQLKHSSRGKHWQVPNETFTTGSRWNLYKRLQMKPSQPVPDKTFTTGSRWNLLNRFQMKPSQQVTAHVWCWERSGAIKGGKSLFIWMLESATDNCGFHHPTQYNMVVRWKACGNITMGGRA